MNIEQAAQSLGALSQVHRLKALRALVVAGRTGSTPGVLSGELGISPASMSFHLKELLYAGLVSQTRDGRHLIYRASLDRMNDLMGFLTSNCCEGQPCELEAPSCTGNSARSILAEALMNDMRQERGFKACPASESAER